MSVETSDAVVGNNSEGLAEMLRKPPVLGLLIIVLMFCEKMLAHS